MRKQRNEEQTLKESRAIFQKIAENDTILRYGEENLKKQIQTLTKQQLTIITQQLLHIIHTYHNYINQIKAEIEDDYGYTPEDTPLSEKVAENDLILIQGILGVNNLIDQMTKNELEQFTTNTYKLIREIHEYLIQVNAEFNQEVEEFTTSILDEIMNGKKINIDYTKEKRKKNL